MKKKYCLNCGKERNRSSKALCRACEDLRRIVYLLPNKCIDCGKIIHRTSKRCNKCHNSGKNARKYIDGRTLKKYYCKCEKELSNYRHKKCPHCSVIGRKLSKEHCLKISINTKKRLSISENNPNWQGGLSFQEYPKEFTNEFKLKIRQRDNYECQNCSMTEEESLIVWGEVLHVHHIDYNKKNCNEENLVTACRSCNIRANYNRKYWKEYYTKKKRSFK